MTCKHCGETDIKCFQSFLINFFLDFMFKQFGAHKSTHCASNFMFSFFFITSVKVQSLTVFMLLRMFGLGQKGHLKTFDRG